MIIYRSERYRLYPTPTQVERLEAWQHALRFLWNLANEQRLAMLARCRVDRKIISCFDQINELTELRKIVPWLADVPRNVCAQLFIELDKAWQVFFTRKGGRPRFKSKARGDTAAMIAPKAHRVEGLGRSGAVVFPKIGRISAVIHRPITGKAKMCAIVRDGDQWFASVLCEQEIDEPSISNRPPIALDVGIAKLVADSGGAVIENPRHAAAMKLRLARAQRTVRRRQKGSKNQQKAKARTTKLRRKIRRQREHALHVASHHYAKNHGTVIVEALNIQNMTRSAKGTVDAPCVNVAQKRGLNREIREAAWGKFVSMLRYKVIPEGGQVIEVPTAYSSQTCSVCGVVDAESRRAQDVFLCTACGHFDNADINAARVLLARGLKKIAVEATVTVCGGIGARGRPVKQKLRVVRRGTRQPTG